MRQSSIAGAGLGVFAMEMIPRGMRFGPYMGRKVPAAHVDDDTDTSYMWEVYTVLYRFCDFLGLLIRFYICLSVNQVICLPVNQVLYLPVNQGIAYV